MEIIDILHSVETLLRVHFKNRESKLDLLIIEVKNKNFDRGYYDKKVY